MKDETLVNEDAAVVAKRGPSFGFLLVLVVCLLWTTCLALVLINPTARLRATGYAESWVLTRSTPDDPAEVGSPGETEEQRLARVAAELAVEHERLAQWAAVLNTKEADLTLAQAELAEREAAVVEEATMLAGTVADLNRLARLCRQMRPSDAAAILEPLADHEILAILRGLSDADAAKILTAMAPARAAELIKLMTPQAPDTAG